MKILVTAGPTREYLDSVRFLSNASSGKMGYAVAAAAATRGHQVVLVSGPVSLAPPENLEFVPVISADEMFRASVDVFDACGAAIMVAAVCDYAPVHRETVKRPKMDAPFDVGLKPTRDICAHLGSIKGERVLIGFAMEDHHHRARAEAKLLEKGCDAIVLNDVSVVGADRCTIQVYRTGAAWSQEREQSKADAARAVVALVESIGGERDVR